MKTVLITGSSSGYGLETARHFHAQGWNVIATMPNAARRHSAPVGATARPGARRDEAREYRRGDRARVGPYTCSSTTPASGSIGVFEATPMTHRARSVRDQYLRRDGDDAGGAAPASRERRSGVVVNVTSSVTLTPGCRSRPRTPPARAAIEGFTGSLAHELEPLRRARQAGRASGYGPSHAIREQRGASRMAGIDSRRVRGVRRSRSSLAFAQAGRSDDGVRRGPSRLPRRERCDAAASVSQQGPDAVALAQAR